MNISLSNVREWLPFAFIIVGVALALIAPFLMPGRKRRNQSMQLISTFIKSMHTQDIEHWREIFHGTREAARAPAGHFINRLGKPVPLALMWAADSEDHTAIQRIAECLEKACGKMLDQTLDVKLIWFEIGQLMESMHDWLEDIPGV